MCCFSRAVRFVGKTRIFARALPNGRQVLAYTMNVELDEELAMVLPLPTPPGSHEGAVSFIDLEAYPKLFDDLCSAFPDTFMFQSKSRGPSLAALGARLRVHDVGLFEASFVPTLADFGRLDARFRMPPNVWDSWSAVEDWGFAVFQLKPNKGWFRPKVQSVHPMAFSFPTRDAEALFFPTVHVHDGTKPLRAHFDHELYCQAEGVLGQTLGWSPSTGALDAHVDVARAQSLIEPALGGFKLGILGERPNRDTWLRPPKDVRVEELRGRGECHAFTIDGQHAYADPEDGDARFVRWCETSANHLGRLCRGLAARLRALESAKRSDWRLGPLTDDLAPHFMNGNELWSGTSYMNGSAKIGTGPGRAQFKPFSDLVSPQSITLGFEALPSQSLAQAIHAELSRLLDEAVRPL